MIKCKSCEDGHNLAFECDCFHCGRKGEVSLLIDMILELDDYEETSEEIINRIRKAVKAKQKAKENKCIFCGKIIGDYISNYHINCWRQKQNDHNKS